LKPGSHPGAGASENTSTAERHPSYGAALRLSNSHGRRFSGRLMSLGRILLEEVVPLSVQGSASLGFAAGGVRYHMTMPGSELS
jgi:hypothetical protein